RAEQVHHEVLPNATALPAEGLVSRQRGRRRYGDGQVVDRTRALVRNEKRLEVPSQLGVAGAVQLEKPFTIRIVALDRLGEQILEPLPALGRHGRVVRRGSSHPRSSRFSQARAIVHSRLTVAGETSRASAVS